MPSDDVPAEEQLALLHTKQQQWLRDTLAIHAGRWTRDQCVGVEALRQLAMALHREQQLLSNLDQAVGEREELREGFENVLRAGSWVDALTAAHVALAATQETTC
jgi:hypothetical protein